MFIYYCPNCHGFDAYEDLAGHYTCSSCNKPYLSLEISVEQWNTLSNDQMLAIIEKAEKPKIRIPVFDHGAGAEDKSSEGQLESEFSIGAYALSKTNQENIKVTFCMSTITVSERGANSQHMDWCITGLTNNPRGVEVGDYVDVYNHKHEILGSLMVGKINIWAEDIPEDRGVGRIFAPNEITLVFKGKTEDYKLRGAKYILSKGSPDFTDEELEAIRKEDAIEAGINLENKKRRSFLEASIEDDIKKEGKIKYSCSPEEAKRFRGILTGEIHVSLPGNPQGVKCPYCGSELCSKLGHFGRGASIAVWGLASNKIGKQWKCNMCKSTF